MQSPIMTDHMIRMLFCITNLHEEAIVQILQPTSLDVITDLVLSKILDVVVL